MFDCNVLCPGPQLGCCGKLHTTSIVFKTLGKHLGGWQIKVNLMFLELFKEMEDEQDMACCMTQTYVLSFNGAQSNQFLLFACPLDGAVGKLDDETSSGLDVGGILWLGFVPCTGEVSVCKTFKEGTFLVENEALALGSSQMTNNALGSDEVSSFGVVAELGTLMDSKGDVRSGC